MVRQAPHEPRDAPGEGAAVGTASVAGALKVVLGSDRTHPTRNRSPQRGGSLSRRRIERPIVRPRPVLLDRSEPLLMPPQHLAPIVTAGLDAVFLDQVPDDLFERDSPRWEMQAWKRSVPSIGIRGREYVQVAAWIRERGIPVVLVREYWTRVVQAVPSPGRCTRRG